MATAVSFTRRGGAPNVARRVAVVKSMQENGRRHLNERTSGGEAAPLNSRSLAALYAKANNLMRNVDGLQPQEAFDELLKFLFMREQDEVASVSPQVLPLLPDSPAQLRSRLTAHLKKNGSAATTLFRERKFCLSDEALVALHELMGNVRFSDLPIDTRSAALREFLNPELRRGLGIFLTPDEVVQMIVAVVQPQPRSRVYDPACGSGTFLIETFKFWHKNGHAAPLVVYGTDKSPRMLLLAELNFAHNQTVIFHHKVIDVLFEPPVEEDKSTWPSPNSADFILTNPPFGVYFDSKSANLERYDTCRDSTGAVVAKQQSELIFIEQSLRLLRPGGSLAIVLPKGVISNQSVRIGDARRAIGKLGYVYAVVSLPPETFAAAGTQTTTSVVFMRKYERPSRGDRKEADETVNIAYADVTNIGYDATGRQRHGSQLPRVARALRTALASGKTSGLARILPPVRKGESLTGLSRLMSSNGKPAPRHIMRDIVERIVTGSTPARNAYTDNGLFVVKVGNLSGCGINWSARERNYIALADAVKRERSDLMLRRYDILLTSSAHSRAYIGKKVDIITEIPEWVGARASFVGEVMLIRPNPSMIDPFVLLAYLRSPGIHALLQRLARGQTAHLHPSDVYELAIDGRLLKPNRQLVALAHCLREQQEANDRLNTVNEQARSMSAQAFSLAGSLAQSP